jgi:hypothetical protein
MEAAKRKHTTAIDLKEYVLARRLKDEPRCGFIIGLRDTIVYGVVTERLSTRAEA